MPLALRADAVLGQVEILGRYHDNPGNNIDTVVVGGLR